MELIEFLLRTDVFFDIDRELLKPVCDLAQIQQFEEGEFVFEQGERCRDFYIVKVGTIAINKRVAGHRKRNLSNLGSGGLFGELALFDSAPRSADAMVLEKSEIIAFPCNQFLKVLDENSRLASIVLRKLIVILSKRLRNTDELLDQGAIWGFRMEHS